MGIGMNPIEALWILFIGGVTICAVVIIIVVHISFAVAVFRDATSLPASPQTDFRKSNHLVFSNTSWWDIYNNSLLDHASFMPESIDPRNPTGRLK